MDAILTYISKDFLNIHSDVIKNAKDVCFRDKKSYELFSNLKNTRCCGDIVFSMDTKEILIREEKSNHFDDRFILERKIQAISRNI